MGLFDKLKQFYQLTKNVDNQAIARSMLHFAPKNINSAGRILFDNIQLSGNTIFIVPGRVSWNPDSEYFRAARDSARRGINISRVFIIQSQEYLTLPLLQKQIDLDKASGIKTDIVISSIEFEQGFQFPLSLSTLDYGFWDNEIVTYIIYNQEFSEKPQTDEWLISQRPEDKENALRNWELVSKNISSELIQNNILLRRQIEGSLIEPAMLATMLSDTICSGNYFDTTTSCKWNHGISQYLAMLDLVPTASWFTEFFQNELPTGLPDESIKILIFEPVDLSILAQVIYAFRERTNPLITVLCSCNSPLLVNKWYASQHGVSIVGILENFNDYRINGQFDLIIAFETLTYIDEKNRDYLFHYWGNCLQKNGRLIFINSISSNVKGNSIDGISVTKKEVSQIIEYRMRCIGELFPVDTKDLIHKARIFYEKADLHKSINNDEIIALFLNVGLKISKFLPLNIKSELGNKTFVEIIAIKEQ